MNGSTENTANESRQKKGSSDRLINLGTARRMLPLVQQIVGDVLECQRLLAERLPEQDRLDRQRRTLNWPQRSRRYALHEEVAGLEQKQQQSLTELTALGVVLLGEFDGRVGFPTLVNNRQAFFSWKPGEDSVVHWHFEGETTRRSIPPAWLKAAEINLLKKS
jgi:hypothetical protein